MAVAEHDETPQEGIERLARDDEPRVLIALIKERCEEVPEERQKALLEHPDPEVLHALARHSEIKEVLSPLAASDDLVTQLNVAENDRTPFYILIRLRDSPNAWVHWQAGASLRYRNHAQYKDWDEPEPDEPDPVYGVEDDDDEDDDYGSIDILTRLNRRPYL